VSVEDNLVANDAIYMSRDKRVIIYNIRLYNDYSFKITGLVESSSREGVYHRVSVIIKNKWITNGFCDCEGFAFLGGPCIHMIKLRNVGVRAIREYEMSIKH
jgi:hypothetical protein